MTERRMCGGCAWEGPTDLRRLREVAPCTIFWNFKRVDLNGLIFSGLVVRMPCYTLANSLLLPLRVWFICRRTLIWHSLSRAQDQIYATQKEKVSLATIGNYILIVLKHGTNLDRSRHPNQQVTTLLWRSADRNRPTVGHKNPATYRALT